ncbi:MAG: DUF1269 domain-containing protein [Alphaproteobacteria bacterium]|nr:DUF1269 domain-containing protein [Alphaproteobacteria bacterium]
MVVAGMAAAGAAVVGVGVAPAGAGVEAAGAGAAAGAGVGVGGGQSRRPHGAGPVGVGAGLPAGVGVPVGVGAPAGFGCRVGVGSGARFTLASALAGKPIKLSCQIPNAALFLLIHKVTTSKILAALQGGGGTVTRTSLDETKEEVLRVALAGTAASTAEPPGASPRYPFPRDPHPTPAIPVPAPARPPPPMGSWRAPRPDLMTRWRHRRTHRGEGLGKCFADRISHS